MKIELNVSALVFSGSLLDHDGQKCSMRHHQGVIGSFGEARMFAFWLNPDVAKTEINVRYWVDIVAKLFFSVSDEILIRGRGLWCNDELSLISPRF